LSDITFTDEGNPNYLPYENSYGEQEDKLINFTKFHLITKQIQTYLNYQNCSSPYKYDLFYFLLQVIQSSFSKT
jgi:hypothetical protein